MAFVSDFEQVFVYWVGQFVTFLQYQKIISRPLSTYKKDIFNDKKNCM